MSVSPVRMTVLEALLLGFPAQGPYNVVGLIALHLEDGHVEGAHKLPYPVELGLKLGRGLRSLGLVLFIFEVAEGGRGQVEGDGAVGGCPFLNGFQERVGEAEDCRYVLTGLAHREVLPGADCMPRPVYLGVAVYEHQQGLVSGQEQGYRPIFASGHASPPSIFALTPRRSFAFPSR